MLGVFVTSLTGQLSVVGFSEARPYIYSAYGFPLAWDDHYYFPSGCCPPHKGAYWASFDLRFFGLDVAFYIAVVFGLLLISKLVKQRQRPNRIARRLTLGLCQLSFDPSDFS